MGASTTAERGSRSSPLRLIVLAVAGTLILLGVSLVPDFWGLLPGPIRYHPVETGLLGLALGYGLLVWLGNRRGRPSLVRRSRRIRRWIDRVAVRIYPRGLALLIVVGALGLLGTWVPHYLTWPWCRDVDTFAVLARSWDLGLLPYRDIRFYNFPGHIYLHWLLGKLFGWGRTAPFYAFDAATVVGLGVALAFWSRRRLGGMLPGLVGYTAFLAFYLSLEFEIVAQRDWHAILLTVLSLLAAEAWPGPWGRAASAGALALAISIRPHAVLFLPAIASAVLAGAAGGANAGRWTWRALGSWIGMLAVAMALAFAPVLMSGLLGDLARSLRTATYGGPYSRTSWTSVPDLILAQFQIPWIWTMLAGLTAMAVVGPPALRWSARTWILAIVGALLYAPMNPVQHDYLRHAREVVGAVALSLPAAWILSASGLAVVLRLLATVLILYEAMPDVPLYCRPEESLRSLRPLLQGTEPTMPPSGAVRFFKQGRADHYRWEDYRATLNHLRENTATTTIVANVLRHVPFPPLNGPTGRPSPFRTDSGICWMWLVDEDLDATFAKELEQAADSVVVWCPEESETEPRLRLPILSATIRRLYEPAVRFGRIEVWNRKKPSPTHLRFARATGCCDPG